MKARMILTALMAFAVVVAMQAPASAGLVTDTYLVGDKDDFNDGDGDGVFDLVHGEYVPLPYWTYLTPEVGNTDYQMYPALGQIFDFGFTVDPLAVGETIVGATVRIVTFDHNDDSPDFYGGMPGAWGTQPVKLIKGATELALPDLPVISYNQRLVHVQEIVLSPTALALLEGGLVRVTIGTTATIPDWDVDIVDYAELDITYDVGGGEPVPETSAAALLTIGLSGLIRRKRR